MEDDISKAILKMLLERGEPMETMEITRTVQSTRAKVLYRLSNLRGEGKIHGKLVSSGGKGVWVWWK